MEGVLVIVGVNETVGESVIVGVKVTVGVFVMVGEGGKILYIADSPKLFKTNAAPTSSIETRIKRHPLETIA